jgi:hypothetical protein
MLYDLFISHATEDKDGFVRQLAERLKEENVEVWYDEFSLNIGDSLRESIDRGLSQSHFGLVVLSPNFFKKKWTKRELNALFAREEDGVILPIWHQINRAGILEHSPMLADIVALNSDKGLDFVTEKIIKKIHPQGSPLIVARDELIYFGLKPPVVTDEYWLDVIEASNRIPNGGVAIPEQSTWGRWTFPLPNLNSHGEYRGVRLAWTAMQLEWEREAEKQKITQITNPKKVLAFIERMPGLKEVCHKYTGLLAEYAPQLTIKGFGGEFEAYFEEMLRKSIAKQKKLQQQNSPSGTGLTTDKKVPLCDQEISLRHDKFGNYEPGFITCSFVQGELMGPQTRYYEHFDYLVWLLSSESDWLPHEIKKFLLSGFKEWTVWCQYPMHQETGATFRYALCKAKKISDFKLTSKIKQSLVNLIQESVKNLRLKEKPEEILNNFIKENLVEAFIKRNNRKKK